jgi:TLD
VDGAGSGLFAVRSRNGKVFGGYNPSGWRSTDDYTISAAAFLWCLPGPSPAQQVVVKCPIMPGGNCAIFDYATAGPTFGSTDFCVGPPQAAVMGGFAGPDSEDMTTAAGNLRQCRSNIGTAYRNDPAWPARGSMQLVEVEVYCAARQ